MRYIKILAIAGLIACLTACGNADVPSNTEIRIRAEQVKDIYKEFSETCNEYIIENCENPDTIDMDNPIIKPCVLPEYYYCVTEGFDTCIECVSVTYHTEADALLGPMEFFMSDSKTIIGLGYRD